jgi:hypothetical protein
MPELSTLQANVRLELADTSSFWSESELSRAISKTEGLLSRSIPKKAVCELRLVTAATLVVASSKATTAYKPIKWESEVVKTAAGVTLTRNTDYTINYMTGVIVEIGALLPDAVDYTITYSLDPQRLDITGLLDNPLKVTRVEYPVGDQPVSYLPNFDLIDGYLIFGKDTQLTHNEHIRIYYDAMWEGASHTSGNYPENLADVVTIGAAGQALLMKAEKYTQAAVTEVGLAKTAVGLMSTPLADINTALDKVTTYLTTSGTAATVLTLVESNATELRTAIQFALNKSSTFLYATATDPSAQYYLTQGDAFIQTVNVSDQVSQKYSDYARACISLYNGLVAEATTRIENIRTYIQEAGAWTAIAEGYIGEATQRIAEAQAWTAQADRYVVTNREYLNIAGRYLASGQAKVNEFYLLIGSKVEVQQVRTSSTQATAY